MEADIVVTATGLQVQMLGGAKFTVDGEPIPLTQRVTYKGVLLEGVPNAALIFGYVNASWTLKADIAATYLTRLLKHMDSRGVDQVVVHAQPSDRDTGSVLGALRAIVTVVGIAEMKPPIKDLLPRLTPILRNRHEKVQENTIDLVGRIADRGPDAVTPREWMRICFELLDMLKAHKKGIRRAANNTFGFIAKAIGPQDVLATLLNNLRVQERQSRVNTAVAIGIAGAIIDKGNG